MDSWKTITEIRNTIEPLLRKFIRQTMRSRYGKSIWIKKVLEAIPQVERDRLVGVDADTILNNHLYLTNLREVLNKFWEDFKFLETGERKSQITKIQFLTLIDTVNDNRQDAHAKEINEAQMDSLKISAKHINDILLEYIS